MAFDFKQFQYFPTPVLSAMGREDTASTTSAVLVDVGTGVDVELKCGIYIVGASALVQPITGTNAFIQFLAGSDVVVSAALPQGATARIGGLFMLSLMATEMRRFKWQAISDGIASVNLSDLHFIAMSIAPPTG